MSASDCFQGVSNCYVFKSRLQEYAQKVGLPTPVYETIKEGPSHEPSFRSTVIVNDVRYDSLPGFFNRKAAEQSAAEVALVELAKTGEMNECISQPVHETGLCKNLLQEYAQKMNYAIPSYDCRKDETPGRMPLFSCTVDIGGIKYIGATAKTKKEAEIKAARTALLAIQSSSDGSYEKSMGNNSMYTVIPCKKKATDLGIIMQETIKTALKPKKGRFKKKPRKKKLAEDNAVDIDGHIEQQLDQTVVNMEMVSSGRDRIPILLGNEAEKPASDAALVDPIVEASQLQFYHSGDAGAPNYRFTPMFSRDGLTSLVGEAGPIVNNSSVCQGEVPRIVEGVHQTACGAGAGSNQG